MAKIIERMICVKCHSLDDLSRYNKQTNKQGITTQYYICRPCNAARAKKYRNTPRGKKRQARINASRRKGYRMVFNPPMIEYVEQTNRLEKIKDDPVFYSHKAVQVSEKEWRKRAKESELAILKKYGTGVE